MSDALQVNTPSNQSLGEILRHARQEQGLELSDVAQVTHVRKEYLKALDEGRYSDLPEDVYSKNFLRLYAQAVSLDEKPLLQLYNSERHGQKLKAAPVSPPTNPTSDVSVKESSPTIKPQATRKQNSFSSLLSTLLLVCILVIVAVWGFNRFLLPGSPDTTRITNSGETLPLTNGTTRPPVLPSSATDNTETNNQAATSDDTSGTTAANTTTNNAVTNNTDTTSTSEGNNATDEVPDAVISDEAVLPEAVPTGEIVSLTILSNPPGAQVFLDNFPFADVTPIELAPVTAGENRIIRVELEGYETYESPLDLSFDRNIDVSLSPANTVASSEDDNSLASQEGQIAMSIEAASWLEVYQGTARSGGPTLLYRTVEPGESFSFDLPVYLHVGNGGGIRYSINGQERGLIGSSGQVVSQAYIE